MAEADLLVSCPYNPAHRIKKSKLMNHIVKCKKYSKTENLEECPLDRSHVVNRECLREHIAHCTGKVKLVDTNTEIFKPKANEPSMIVNSYSTENWDEEPEATPYNPMEVSANKPVIRCVSGLSKSERKKFRENERMRIANLKGYHSISAASSSMTKDTAQEAPLRPPRDATLSGRFCQGGFVENTQTHDRDNGHDDDDCYDEATARAKYAKLRNDVFHRLLYNELAPEDDNIKQVEPLHEHETASLFDDCFQHNGGNASSSTADLIDFQEANVKKTEMGAIPKPFNVDNTKEEKDECVANTSSVFGERHTDRLLEILKNKSGVKKVQDMENTIKIQQNYKNSGEKESDDIFDQIDERLVHLKNVAKESARLVEQLEELKLQGQMGLMK